MRPSFHSPRTQAAIKVRADQLRKTDSAIRHLDALNKVALEAGFQNWAHAKRSLPVKLPLLTLRCNWYNRQARLSCQEIIKYPIRLTATQLVAMKLQGGRVSNFLCTDSEDAVEGISDNDLMSRSYADDQYQARYWLDQALRELLFMEVTGLRPRRHSKKAYPLQRGEWLGTTYYPRY
ncbi:hypothetical protein [Pseudomonas luteola]|uniref:hypothetical protein n=1 Tax=Pseudomonas luteola TaxID=47886 RepID=UPI0028A10274|nr:hypothetical protein [Pseudomonas luteola]